MFMANQLDSNAEYHTSFVNFYAGMLKTPFIGNKLNYLLPSSILIFAILFILLSIVVYESKAVKAVRLGKIEA